MTQGQPTAGIDDRDPSASGGSATPRPDSAYWRGDYRDQAAWPDARQSSDESARDRVRQAYAVQAIRQKDHVAAGLLAIFLGMFGVHKFYLGYNQSGFIMLAVTVIGGILTFGLAGAVIEIIAVIEGVLYLLKSQTEFDAIYVMGQRDWF